MPSMLYTLTEHQSYIIYQLRNFSKYVSYKDLKALMADLKTIYAATLCTFRAGLSRSGGQAALP